MLNTSWDLAGSIKTDMQTAIANAGSSFIDPDNPPEMIAATVSAATVTEPTVSIPASVDLAAIIADFDDEQTALVNSLVAQFSSFSIDVLPGRGRRLFRGGRVAAGRDDRPNRSACRQRLRPRSGTKIEPGSW